MLRLRRLAPALAFAVLLAAVARLARLEAAGPAHADLLLDGGVPATLYLPGAAAAAGGLPPPAPLGERPPALVLAHGLCGDRALLGTLARRLAGSGFAVLAIDLRGHGENRNRFDLGGGRADHLAADLAAAVDFLRASPHVDGARIALAGHSLGAAAVLDYASRDSGLDAALMISGGREALGPYRPPNALFLVAARDPRRIRAPAAAAASQLAGGVRIEPGRTYGDPALGSGVRYVEVPGVGHTSVVWSRAATLEIARWLDAAFGLERSRPVPLDRARLDTAAVALLALLFALPALGAGVGRLAPPRPPPPPLRGGAALAALALAAALPLAGLGRPAAFLGLALAEPVILALALAGFALLLGLALAGRLDAAWLLERKAASLAAGLAGFAALYALATPLGVAVHRLGLGPERLRSAALAALLLLPFLLALEVLLRRGGPARAALTSAAGRVLALALLVLGALAGLLPEVALLAVAPLAGALALLEIPSAAIQRRSRNPMAIAAFQAASLAWLLAAVAPLG